MRLDPPQRTTDGPLAEHPDAREGRRLPAMKGQSFPGVVDDSGRVRVPLAPGTRVRVVAEP